MFIYVWIYAHMYRYIEARGERALESLELELQVVSLHVDAGNRTLVLWKSSHYS